MNELHEKKKKTLMAFICHPAMCRYNTGFAPPVDRGFGSLFGLET